MRDNVVAWAHPCDLEMTMVEEGEHIGDFPVADSGALIIRTAGGDRLVFESPMDVITMLKQARELVGDFVLEHPELFDDVTIEEDTK